MLSGEDLYNAWTQSLIPTLYPDEDKVAVETNQTYNLKNYYDNLTQAEKDKLFISIKQASNVIHEHILTLISEHKVETDINVTDGIGFSIGHTSERGNLVRV